MRYHIISYHTILNDPEYHIKNWKYLIKKKRKDKHLSILTSLRKRMSCKNKRLSDITQEQGSWSWITVLPIKRLGFSLSKAEFCGAVYLQYGLPLKRLLIHCGCSKFTQPSMRYRAKKGDLWLQGITNYVAISLKCYGKSQTMPE